MLKKVSRLIRSFLTRASLLLGNLDISNIYQIVGRSYTHDPLFHLQVPLEFRGFATSQLTGSQIRDLGHKITNAIVKEGLNHNARVIIAKANHPDYLLYILSVIRAGGIPVSVNRDTGWQFISSVQKVTGASVILTDAETLALDENGADLKNILERNVRIFSVSKLPFNTINVPGLKGIPRHLFPLIEAAPATPPARRVLDDRSPVALFHTSGTTGIPKLCMWNRKNITRIWKIMMLLLPITGNTRGMITCPFSHALFFALQTAGTLCGGLSYMVSRFEAKECLSAIESHRISHYMGFPYTFMLMAAEDLSHYDLRSMKIWSTGADSAHAAQIEKMVQTGSVGIGPFRTKGSLFVDSYGSTEIGAGGIMQFWWPRSKPVPCLQGKPLPTQFSIRIADRNGKDLPTGEVGRILVKSTTQFAGYWDNHSAWAENWRDGWWWAGDVGKIDAKGRLHFLDREADSVRTDRGTLYTLPVEERLLMHERVMEAAVVQRTTQPADQIGKAVAYVVPKGYLRRGIGRPESVEKLQVELLEFVNNGIKHGPFLAEVLIIPFEELPLGVTGKVLKRTLRKIADSSLELSQAHVTI